MFARRLVSGILTLVAVQYAAFGAGSICASAHESTQVSAAEDAGGMARHGGSNDRPTAPCAPTSPDSHAGHAPAGCMAMAGCAPPGLAAAVAPEVVAAPLTIAALVTDAVSLRSIISAPETPPPIT